MVSIRSVVVVLMARNTFEDHGPGGTYPVNTMPLGLVSGRVLREATRLRHILARTYSQHFSKPDAVANPARGPLNKRKNATSVP